MQQDNSARQCSNDAARQCNETQDNAIQWDNAIDDATSQCSKTMQQDNTTRHEMMQQDDSTRWCNQMIQPDDAMQ